jgi:hypothetical protein
MSSQSLPDFDLLWDSDHPEHTETRFREILLQFPVSTKHMKFCHRMNGSLPTSPSA